MVARNSRPHTDQRHVWLLVSETEGTADMVLLGGRVQGGANESECNACVGALPGRNATILRRNEEGRQGRTGHSFSTYLGRQTMTFSSSGYGLLGGSGILGLPFVQA